VFDLARRVQEAVLPASVILTADHGEEFGEHGLYFHRNRPYDELIRVPLFLRTPDDVPCPSQPVTEQRELLDVAPTVCRLHDTDPPESFLGTDLRSGGQRDVVTHGSFRDEGPVAAVRTDGWKYIDAGADTELYNLDTDPREQDNLSEKRRDQCRTYRSKIPNRLLEDADDGVPEDVDRDTRQRLEELGYLE
jgi:arylsulfatase A-like enzyme